MIFAKGYSPKGSSNFWRIFSSV